MKKVLVSVFFLVSSLLVAGLCYAAWRPCVPVPQPEEPAVPALEKPAVVLEASAVLVLAKPAQGAEKARPVAARPKTWQCGERIVLEAGHKARASQPSSARPCGWR